MSKEEKGKKDYNIRVLLEGEMARKFETVKTFYGLEKNADLLRLLVTLAYERILKANNNKKNKEQRNHK